MNKQEEAEIIAALKYRNVKLREAEFRRQRRLEREAASAAKEPDLGSEA